MVKKSNLNLNLNSKSIETSLIPWEINEATLGIPNCFKKYDSDVKKSR
jgi:hypothetical protein